MQRSRYVAVECPWPIEIDPKSTVEYTACSLALDGRNEEYDIVFDMVFKEQIAAISLRKYTITVDHPVQGRLVEKGTRKVWWITTVSILLGLM